MLGAKPMLADMRKVSIIPAHVSARCKGARGRAAVGRREGGARTPQDGQGVSGGEEVRRCGGEEVKRWRGAGDGVGGGEADRRRRWPSVCPRRSFRPLRARRPGSWARLRGMRRLASRPLPQARFACARLPRWPALSSVAACLSTDSSNPKGAAGSLDTARRTAHDRAMTLRTSEGGERQSSDESPTTVPLVASLTTHQIANTLRGYARRHERPVDSLRALAASCPGETTWGFGHSSTRAEHWLSCKWATRWRGERLEIARRSSSAPAPTRPRTGGSRSSACAHVTRYLKLKLVVITEFRSES